MNSQGETLSSSKGGLLSSSFLNIVSNTLDSSLYWGGVSYWMLPSVDNLSPMSIPLHSAMPWKSKTISPCSSNSSKETVGFCILLSSLGSHLHSNFGLSLGSSYFSQQLIVKEVVFFKLFSVEDSIRYLVHYKKSEIFSHYWYGIQFFKLRFDKNLIKNRIKENCHVLSCINDILTFT